MTAKGEDAPTPLGISGGVFRFTLFQILLRPAIGASIGQRPLRPRTNLVMNAA